MQCPNDNTTLVMADRVGIEIDYCPTCRGVWLDRGELDKIVERSEASQRGDNRGRDSDYRDGHGSRGHSSSGHGSGRRRGGWLGELFD